MDVSPVRLSVLHLTIHLHHGMNALYSTRLCHNVRAFLDPWPNPPTIKKLRGANNPTLSSQNETGRACTEGTWSAAGDEIIGVWLLRNFRRLVSPPEAAVKTQQALSPGSRQKHVGGEELVADGLKGWISFEVGVRFSAKGLGYGCFHLDPIRSTTGHHVPSFQHAQSVAPLAHSPFLHFISSRTISISLMCSISVASTNLDRGFIECFWAHTRGLCS